MDLINTPYTVWHWVVELRSWVQILARNPFLLHRLTTALHWSQFQLLSGKFSSNFY